MSKLNGLSLFANVGVAETYLDELGIEIKVANELEPKRAKFYSHLYPKTNMIIGDITDEEIRKAIVLESKKNNVDFIGLHQINPPVTSENIKLFQKLVADSGDIKTVLLSKKVPINEIVNLLRLVPFDFVQLHRTCSIDDVRQLKDKVMNETGRRIGIIAVFEAENCNYEKVIEMSCFAEFILFDSKYRGGTGIRISADNLKEIAEKLTEKGCIASDDKWVPYRMFWEVMGDFENE